MNPWELTHDELADMVAFLEVLTKFRFVGCEAASSSAAASLRGCWANGCRLTSAACDSCEDHAGRATAASNPASSSVARECLPVAVSETIMDILLSKE